MARPSFGGPAARLMALAERDPRRAGRLALAMASRPGLHGACHLAVGWALFRWERLGPATAALTRAAALLPPASPELLRCRRALLMVRQVGSEGPALQLEWEAHVRQCAEAGALVEQARARCEQAAHLNLLGRSREARALLHEAGAPLQAHGGPADMARHQYLAGVAAVGSGELSAGQALLDAALATFAQLGRPAEVARVRFERAWLHLRRERLDQAEEDLLLALATYQRLELPLRVALCRRDLGTIARYRGDYGRAIALLVAARDQFMELERPDRAAGCDFNLGSVTYMSGLYDLALGAFVRAEQVYEAQGDQFHALVAARNQALTLCARGQHATALAASDALIPRFEALGDQLGLAELAAVRAQALRGLGGIAEAAAALRDANQRFMNLGSLPAAGECLLDLGWLHLEQGAIADAVGCLEAAAGALADRPAHLWRALYGLGRADEARGDPSSALSRYGSAAEIVAGLRKRLASEHASSRLFSLAQELHHDGLRLAAASGDTALVLALAERQRGLALDRQLRLHDAVAPGASRRGADAAAGLRASLRGEAGAASLDMAMNAYVATLIQERHRVAAPLGPEAPLDLERLRGRLTGAFGQGWSVLCPLFLDDELLTVGLTPRAVELDRQPFDQELRRLIERACEPRYRLEQYRDLGRLRDPGRPAWAGLRALAHRLLPAWLRARLSADHRLLIVPAGPLHGLPWAALRLDDAWLCEQAILELLPALSHAPASRGRPAAGPALLIGCGAFGERAAPLPAALESLELAASAWPGQARRLAGEQATCEALRELSRNGELTGDGLIHIASHAQLGGADGLLAHIKLADDDLLLDDLLQLRLRASLVVLAACEGGAGSVLPGDEVLGLVRALLAAGAASVIANLWPIYDRGTLAFLGPLYRALAAGADAATALACAQRALIAGAHDDQEGAPILRTPLIWGGFSIVSSGITHDAPITPAAP